jgi:hypothetical protein
MDVRRVVVKCSLVCVGALVLSALPSSRVFARTDTEQAGAKHHGQAAGLIQAVREATERFKDVSVAETEGYSLMFGCVSGPDSGAMGLHYVNLPLVLDGVLDPAKPEIIIYEPLPNGRLKMTGADFLVFAADWHKNNTATPDLQGQLLHLFESPNRFGLPDFYTLHVWAWKDNPTGAFTNWHPNVSCDAFAPGPQ